MAVPTVTTTAASNILATSFTTGGNVTSDGGLEVTGRGVCWSLSPDPVYPTNSYTLNGSGTGSYVSYVTSVVAINTYYVRAYAYNAEGIAYGNEIQVQVTILSSVPNTETFSLINVTDIITAAALNMVSCYSNAVINRFDRKYYPDYMVEGPHALIANSLLNFRNYEAPVRPPVDFSCIERKTTSLRWTWLDNSWDEEGFHIQRSPDGTTGWSAVQTTAANAEGWTNTGLSVNTTYYYRIRTFKGTVYSDWVYGNATTLAVTKDDWYLPSLYELREMYRELKAYSVGNFTNDYYWSSTQAASDKAWVVQFTGGALLYSGKNQYYSVRAICSFEAAGGAYAIRDAGPHGGLIFHIQLKSGVYVYFESKTTDQSVNYIWSNVSSSVTTAIGIGMGLFNTFNIITQVGHTDSAAKLCNDL